jgi:O-antigen ligase
MGSLTSPFGPFINHNLFAGYLELLVFLPAGMAITGGARGPARLFFAFASLIMGLSILLSLSRGGAISLGAGMIFLATMSGVVSRREGYYESQTRSRLGALISHSRPAIVLGAMACAIALGAVWLGAEPIIHRAMSGRLADAGTGEVTFYLSRGWIWQGAWTMICANPISGVGLGAYETAYPVYSAHDGTLNVSTAHNDYLQIFADGGGVGAALALWFLSALFHAIFRGLRSRDRLLSRLALGCGASILALLVHSFFDSNLQIPSTALLFLLHSALVSNHEAGAPAQAKSDLEWNPLKAKAKTAGVWRIV